MAVSFRRATFQQVRGSAGVVLILLGLVVSRGGRECFGLMGAARSAKDDRQHGRVVNDVFVQECCHCQQGSWNVLEGMLPLFR